MATSVKSQFADCKIMTFFKRLAITNLLDLLNFVVAATADSMRDGQERGGGTTK